MNEKTIKYWIELSNYDLETANAMLKTKRFLYVGFMAHQTIEKMLKAYIVKIKNEVPSYTHNLLLLVPFTSAEKACDVEALKQNFKVKLVVLFGSYAKGNPEEYSDIDVAVFVEKDGKGLDYVEESAMLFTLVRNIDVRIEPTLFYTEELEKYEKASFINDILTTGELIYQYK